MKKQIKSCYALNICWGTVFVLYTGRYFFVLLDLSDW